MHGIHQNTNFVTLTNLLMPVYIVADKEQRIPRQACHNEPFICDTITQSWQSQASSGMCASKILCSFALATGAKFDTAHCIL